MKYIVQIFAGGWSHRNYTAEEIIERLRLVSGLMPVKAVIIGWNPDRVLYESVGRYLKKAGIQMLLWLPVFSEFEGIGDVSPEESLDLWGERISPPVVQDGEGFVFCCPSSEKNPAIIKEKYENEFSDLDFDGVFLDRIRTQSFVAGVKGVLSCGCARCAGFYERNGLPLGRVAKRYEELGDHFFDVSGYKAADGFDFKDPLASDFFRLKGKLITEAIDELCIYFKNKGLSVGLDLFAPLMSSIVGQDYKGISKNADFIKPMLYRRTDAPAGIIYEYELMRKCAPLAEGFEDPDPDIRFLSDQISSFSGLPCKKYPGIEINYREDIARTDPLYIKESLKTLESLRVDGAVLSWDIMLSPLEHLEAAGSLAGSH